LSLVQFITHSSSHHKNGKILKKNNDVKKYHRKKYRRLHFSRLSREMLYCSSVLFEQLNEDGRRTIKQERLGEDVDE